MDQFEPTGATINLSFILAAAIPKKMISPYEYYQYSNMY